MSDEAKPVFSCAIPVRWGDMDAFGHVNNTLYLRYIEEARFLWMQSKGIPIGGDSYPVVVTIGCTFLRPVFYPDTLRIDCYISEPGRSSFIIDYRIFSESDPLNPTATSHSKVVWVEAKTGKSTPLPDSVRSWF
ncbi:acyl-CoA thioesterase [Cellvibrio polysaccharolyticus]|uniref:Acyl-CoA thioesterase n=1 Tax=Cellvibrio polysaccharolyticus TaxID=2082724 RepID=A0A928V926_9GAMM|nr:thioesterase family protein [Cellvibrio polysaccharolyticus]MBE8718982.1 acyl-CoA thioesterase [Cellvibrio polysaccharolyticus]